MRKIKVSLVSKVISGLCIRANINLRKDVLAVLKKAFILEKNKKAKNILGDLIKNASLAKRQKIAICQDTGMAVVFVDMGQNVSIVGGSLEKAINEGIKDGYKKGYLRKSVVSDPFLRKNTNTNTPGIIHYNIVPGNKIKITVLPKGFGCENVSKTKMLRPTDGIKETISFILDTVKEAGPDACPPFVVGVGIGGTLDYACLLAKKALLKSVDRRPSTVDRKINKLENELLKKINQLGIGPMGLGGRTTCLGANIQTYPTHIAGLPVAVNISCHALRSASIII